MLRILVFYRRFIAINLSTSISTLIATAPLEPELLVQPSQRWYYSYKIYVLLKSTTYLTLSDRLIVTHLHMLMESA